VQKEATRKRVVVAFLDFWENLKAICLSRAAADRQNLDGVRVSRVEVQRPQVVSEITPAWIEHAVLEKGE